MYSLLQLLSCREARGVVIGYRVVSTVRQVNVANCPHGEITPMNTTMLISNRSISHRFNVSPCASYVVTINARTTVGFNETLRLNKIVIPSRAEGLYVNFIVYVSHMDIVQILWCMMWLMSLVGCIHGCIAVKRLDGSSGCSCSVPGLASNFTLVLVQSSFFV